MSLSKEQSRELIKEFQEFIDGFPFGNGKVRFSPDVNIEQAKYIIQALDSYQSQPIGTMALCQLCKQPLLYGNKGNICRDCAEQEFPSLIDEESQPVLDAVEYLKKRGLFRELPLIDVNEEPVYLSSLLEDFAQACIKAERENQKKKCCDFFRWWWNQPGNNTEEGYDEWIKSNQ